MGWRRAVPAVACGNDQRVAHAGAPQAVPQLVEEAVHQRLQRQDQEEHAEEGPVARLLETNTKHSARYVITPSEINVEAF